MAQMEFNKNKDKKKKTNPIAETEIREPEVTFSLDTFQEQVDKDKKVDNSSKNRIGRPRKNKEYSSMRLQKQTVNRVNALQNTLEFETQDDLIDHILTKVENSLMDEQRIMYDMYLKTYMARQNKK